MATNGPRSVQTGGLFADVAGVPVVNVWYGGQSIGVYRVKAINCRTMVINRGEVPLRVGTALEIVDFQGRVTDMTQRRLRATVSEAPGDDVRLIW